MIKKVSDRVSMLDIVEASEGMGVKTNVTKYSEFAYEQKFIGFLWNCKTKTVSLPGNKLIKRKEELKKFLAKKSFSTNEVETFNGKLGHLTLILPQLKAYLAANYKWVAVWRSPGHRKMPDDVKEDLLYWRETLDHLQPTRMIPDHIVKNVGWVGDASTEYGIGIIIG
jgi:hypothetical protein